MAGRRQGQVTGLHPRRPVGRRASRSSGTAPSPTRPATGCSATRSGAGSPEGPWTPWGSPRPSGKAPVRWVAIRHGLGSGGNDHLHIAVSLVRTTGPGRRCSGTTRPCRPMPHRSNASYGLSIVGGRSTAGQPGLTRGETEKALREGAAEPARTRLARAVREAATGTRDEAEFVRRLAKAGLVGPPPLRGRHQGPCGRLRGRVRGNRRQDRPLRRAGHSPRTSPSPSSASSGRRRRRATGRARRLGRRGGRPGRAARTRSCRRLGPARPSGPSTQAYEALQGVPADRPRPMGRRRPRGGRRLRRLVTADRGRPTRSPRPGGRRPGPSRPRCSKGTPAPVRPTHRGFRGAAMVVTQGRLGHEDRGTGWALLLGQLNRTLRPPLPGPRGPGRAPPGDRLRASTGPGAAHKDGGAHRRQDRPRAPRGAESARRPPRPGRRGGHRGPAPPASRPPMSDWAARPPPASGDPESAGPHTAAADHPASRAEIIIPTRRPPHVAASSRGVVPPDPVPTRPKSASHGIPRGSRTAGRPCRGPRPRQTPVSAN